MLFKKNSILGTSVKKMNPKTTRIIISVLICLIAGAIGAVATQTSVNTWYTTLNKPSFNPPNYIFGPVWTLLYILMGIAAGKIWNYGFYHKWVKTALYHFGFQLILNISWSLVFFGINEILGALLVIIGLLVLLIFTYRWFKIIDTNAALLLIPYILWVAFASLLNFKIWQLN